MKRLLFLLLFISASADAAVIQLPKGLGQVWDTIVIKSRINGVAWTTDTAYAKDTLNRTITFGGDTLGTVAIYMKNGSDSFAIWTPIQTDGRRSVGPILWWTPNGWDSPTDSFKVRYYKGVTLQSGFPHTYTDRQSYDTTFTVNRDTLYTMYVDVWFAGDTSYNTSIWTLYWDSLGSSGGSGVPAPPSAQLCTVYGYAGQVDGVATKYAEVWATLPDKVNDTCSDVVITNRTVKAETDANGYWFMYLIKSKCLGGAKYKLQYKVSEEAVIERTITVPDSSTYQVAW